MLKSTKMKLRPHLPIKITPKQQKNRKEYSLFIADLLLQIAGKHPVYLTFSVRFGYLSFLNRSADLYSSHWFLIHLHLQLHVCSSVSCLYPGRGVGVCNEQGDRQQQAAVQMFLRNHGLQGQHWPAATSGARGHTCPAQPPPRGSDQYWVIRHPPACPDQYNNFTLNNVKL